MRTILGYALFAILGLVALKLVFGLLSIAFTLFWAALWLAVLGFIFYLVLKVISPRTAERVREAIKGEQHE
jgi:hypothetical protein